MTNELLPCPFCGGNNVMPELTVTSIWRIYITCKDCIADGPAFFFTKKEQYIDYLQNAIDGWNKRVQIGWEIGGPVDQQDPFKEE